MASLLLKIPSFNHLYILYLFLPRSPLTFNETILSLSMIHYSMIIAYMLVSGVIKLRSPKQVQVIIVKSVHLHKTKTMYHPGVAI